jgi:hypothetical protein
MSSIELGPAANLLFVNVSSDSSKRNSVTSTNVPAVTGKINPAGRDRSLIAQGHRDARKPSRVAGSHEDGDCIDIHDLAGLTERCLRDKQQILIAPHSSLHPLIWSDADWACAKASIAVAVDLRRTLI